MHSWYESKVLSKKSCERTPSPTRWDSGTSLEYKLRKAAAQSMAVAAVGCRGEVSWFDRTFRPTESKGVSCLWLPSVSKVIAVVVVVVAAVVVVARSSPSVSKSTQEKDGAIIDARR
jgi:hypothetical protein